MTAKSFFHACAGIFLLVGAYTMGARHAKADFNPSGFPIVGFSGGIVQSPAVLRSDGTVWGFDGSAGGWIPLNTPPIPIPVADVAHFDWVYLASKDGEVWQNQGSQWSSMGRVPAPTVSAEEKTWSGVKEGFRE